MKIIALALVSLVLVLIGQYANLRLKKRIASLKEYILLIESINSQISFSKKSISQIISDFIDKSNVNLKTLCELKEDMNINFHECWENAIEKYAGFDALNNEDKNILLSFGKNLGTTDLNGQINNSKLHVLMLEKQLKTAEENLSGKLKINTALSTVSALGLIIILY